MEKGFYLPNIGTELRKLIKNRKLKRAEVTRMIGNRLGLSASTTESFFNNVLDDKLYLRGARGQVKLDRLAKMLHIMGVSREDPIVSSIRGGCGDYRFSYPPYRKIPVTTCERVHSGQDERRDLVIRVEEKGAFPDCGYRRQLGL